MATNDIKIFKQNVGGTWDESILSSTDVATVMGLTYASASFVKMTGAGTFSLDANTYSTSTHTHTLLTALGNYAWSAALLPQAFSDGIQSSFVQPGADGWPDYGSVMTMKTYSAGGGSLQMYVPYGPGNGGDTLKVRFGNYDVASGNSWTGWKALWHDGNFTPANYSLTSHSHTGIYLPLWGGELTGYLTFSATGDYLVKNDTYAFRAYVDHSYGLKFDYTNMLYAFTTATTNAFSVGVSTGNVIAKGSVTATQINSGAKQLTDWNTGTGFETFVSGENTATNAPSGDFTYGIRLKFHRSESAYHTDLVTSLYNDRMFFRRKTDGGYQGWNELYHSGNLNLSTVPFSASVGTFSNNLFSATLVQAPVLWTTGSIIYSPAELIVISPVDASYQSIHVNNGKFEGSITATSLNSTNSGLDGTYSTFQTIYNANYPTYKHTWLSSISSTESYNGLILRVSTGPSTDKEILKITPSGIGISGVGSCLYFETLGYPATNYIKTVDDYDLKLHCGRGLSSSLTLSSLGTAIFSGSVTATEATLTTGAGLGKMLFSDANGKLSYSGTGKLNYSEPLGIGTLTLGSITIDTSTYTVSLDGGTIGMTTYGYTAFRSAYARLGASMLFRPDVHGVEGSKGYQLLLGRSTFITDLILGDGTGSPGDMASQGNPYVRLPRYGDGIITSNTEAGAGGVLRSVNAFTLTGNILGANTITNETDTYTNTAKVSKITTLSQSEYDAIGTKNANTLYLII